VLILTRREGESLILGGDTVIRILGVRGNNVRVGIEAPEDVSIVRSELIAGSCDHDPVPLIRTSD
jgi:carbon storage regulator